MPRPRQFRRTSTISGPTKAEAELPLLRRARSQARMNDNLKHALDEIIGAIKAGNISLAADLTAVKSYISGSMGSDPKEYRFQEDSDYNKRLFGGKDVYEILDWLHHDLAFSSGTLPSGLTLLSRSGGISQRGLPSGQSRTLRLMREDHEAALRRAHRND